jgi:hypothetical protein
MLSAQQCWGFVRRLQTRHQQKLTLAWLIH